MFLLKLKDMTRSCVLADVRVDQIKKQEKKKNKQTEEAPMNTSNTRAHRRICFALGYLHAFREELIRPYAQRKCAFEYI